MAKTIIGEAVESGAAERAEGRVRGERLRKKAKNLDGLARLVGTLVGTVMSVVFMGIARGRENGRRSGETPRMVPRAAWRCVVGCNRHPTPAGIGRIPTT